MKLILLLVGILSTLEISGAQKQEISNFISGPEVYKLDWNMRALNPADMDNNGALDLIMINNEAYKIDILYQNRPDIKRATKTQHRQWKPILSDSRFSRYSLGIGVSMYALAIGDVDQDGQNDIIYTSKIEGLTVLYQTKKDHWDLKKSFEFISPEKSASTLKIIDIDKDGDQDIVMLAEKEIIIIYQNKHHKLDKVHRFPLSEDKHHNLLVLDVNQDGRLDLVHLVKNSYHALRLHLQNSDNSFGAERVFKLKTPLSRFIAFTDKVGEAPKFAYIEHKTQLLKWGQFQYTSAKQLSIHTYALPIKKIKVNNYAIGNVYGQTHDDLIVGDYKAAQVWLYQHLEHAEYSRPIAFPSLSGIQAIALGDLDNDQLDELYVASKSEKAIGVSHFTSKQRLSYPKPVPNEGEPILLKVLKKTKDHTAALISVVKRKNKRILVVNTLLAKEKQWKQRQALPLEGLKINPTGIKIIDINGDGLQDIILFVVRKPCIVLLQKQPLHFTRIDSIAFQNGLLDNLKPGDLGTMLDQQGNNALLISKKGFARALRYKEETLTVLEQFNARNKNAAILSAISMDIDSKRGNEMLLYQKNSEVIEVLKKDKSEVFRPWKSYAVAKIKLVNSIANKQRIIYFGEDKFWLILIKTTPLEFTSLGKYETDLAHIKYQKLAVADLNSDEQIDFIVMDAKTSHSVEMISNRQGNRQSLWHFKLFDSLVKKKEKSNNEPKELLIHDITGDGLADLVFLVHDRILLYHGVSAYSH